MKAMSILKKALHHVRNNRRVCMNPNQRPPTTTRCFPKPIRTYTGVLLDVATGSLSQPINAHNCDRKLAEGQDDTLNQRPQQHANKDHGVGSASRI